MQTTHRPDPTAADSRATQALPPARGPADLAVRRVVVVGGGTAGWMAAAPLAQRLCRPGAPPCEVVVVESPEIGTVGVGEATLPTLRWFNHSIGLDLDRFMRSTQATFKLGIEFRDWGWLGHRFFHGFGDFGPAIENRPPHLHWLRLLRGEAMASHEDWSTASVMARHNRFALPQDGPPSAANAFSYAFHFDAGLYAALLRDVALRAGALRVEATVVGVEQQPGTGFVRALQLQDGRRIEGDLFVDCSGFRGLLIEQAMQAGYEDWRSWLPCDSALAVPSVRQGPLTPFTTSTARPAGWQWRIPLQHRTGNGLVYCSGFSSDAAAEQVLLQGLDSPALGSARPLRFTTGRRRRMWVGNVVALGLAAGFLEPLESTSIQFIMDGVGRLIELFPERDCDASLANEFNRRMALQYEAVRDFIVLHYKLTRRGESDFWRHCAALPLPPMLAHQLALFRRSGKVALLDRDGFGEASWVAILLGLGERPGARDALVEGIDLAALRLHFSRQRQAIAQTVAAMPEHGDFVARHVQAPPAASTAPATALAPAYPVPA